MQKDTRKKVSFVLFVMAVFMAGVVLTEFHSVWWMVALAGAALLITACFMVTSKEEEKQDPTEKTSEILMIDRLAEYFRSNEKAEKGVYIAVKKQHEDMNRSVEGLLERLDALLTSQENAVKTIVKYNKENARQMALSERDELERLGERMEEMLRLLQADCEIMRNGHETEFSELEHIVNAMEEDVERLLEEETEEEPLNELEPVAEPEEPLVEELLPVEPADMFASSGVDLSDPNRTLSPDDIAALIASLGN